MNKYHTKTLADLLYEELEEEIIQGRYAVGEDISEMRLFQEKGVSLGPVKEALHRLERENLIEPTETGLKVRGVTREDLVDAMYIRARLEGLSAYFAAENATEEGLAEMEEFLREQQEATQHMDAQQIQQHDAEFHGQILNMAGHLLLSDTLRPLMRKISRFRRASVENPQRAEKMLQEHTAICQAIRQKKAELAEQLMDEHVKHATESMLGLKEK